MKREVTITSADTRCPRNWKQELLKKLPPKLAEPLYSSDKSKTGNVTKMKTCAKQVIPIYTFITGLSISLYTENLFRTLF